MLMLMAMLWLGQPMPKSLQFNVNNHLPALSIKFKQKNIGHITNENTFMMCPTFLLLIFCKKTFTTLYKSLKKPWKSRITCKPLRWQRQLPRSYLPWGCYLRRTRVSRAGGIEKALSNLLKSVCFLLHLCLCGHNVDDFLSTFIIPYFHTYVNGYHQIKEPKVKRIERGLRPARLYYFVRLVFFNCIFALS